MSSRRNRKRQRNEMRRNDGSVSPQKPPSKMSRKKDANRGLLINHNNLVEKFSENNLNNVGIFVSLFYDSFI